MGNERLGGGRGEPVIHRAHSAASLLPHLLHHLLKPLIAWCWSETARVRELVTQEKEYWGRRRAVHPTPPTMSTSDWPQWAIARSVISTSMANTFSVLWLFFSGSTSSPRPSFVVCRRWVNDHALDR